jgi:hypothetical protein
MLSAGKHIGFFSKIGQSYRNVSEVRSAPREHNREHNREHRVVNNLFEM